MNNEIEPYVLLRAALHLFQKPPFELNAEQKSKALRQARNEYDIETRVLNSLEAAAVIVSNEEVELAYAEIVNQFDNEDSFQHSLELNELSESTLQAALARQCKVNAVMAIIAARAPQISEVEIGIYYHSHPEKFHKPEQRVARHILISINPDFPENERENAWQRMTELAQTLKRKPHKFADLALRHSECPTAMQGGVLGTVTPGMLYPELDQALFKLKQDEISEVLETEIGFHLIQCQKIIPVTTLSLKNATPKIKALMQERASRNCQRTWLANLTKLK